MWYVATMVASAGLSAVVVYLLMKESSRASAADAATSAIRAEKLQATLQRTMQKLIDLRASVQEARHETLTTEEVVERLKEIKL